MKQNTSFDSLERFGWRFGLESIDALMKELGQPHLSLRFIHISGSNGKGSTCAFMASFLRTAGYKTGLYTSPHLCDIRERFRIDGLWISPSEFKSYSKRVLGACGRVKKKQGHSPTHFEALTALAFLWFKEKKVDWVVLEVGLGGRLDATNLIPTPALALITPVGLEHQDILGRDLSKIASEKAGILKQGGFAATVQTHPTALQRIEKTARANGAKLWVGGRDFRFFKEKKGFRWEGPGLKKSFYLPYLPDFQIPNAALALAGIKLLESQGVQAYPAVLQKSFSNMRWPGRLETVRTHPLLVMDGAHNPGAARALVSSLKARYPRRKWVVLNGFLKDKDYEGVSRILKPLTALSIVTTPESNRAERGQAVSRAWEKAGVRSLWVNDWNKALGLALAKTVKESPYSLLITGSFYLLGDCRRELVDLRGLDRI